MLLLFQPCRILITREKISLKMYVQLKIIAQRYHTSSLLHIAQKTPSA